MLERKREAEKAEAIVAEEVEKFLKWQNSLDAVPTIIALRNKAEQIKKSELERLFNRLPDLSEKDRNIIQTAINAVVNKLIHPPTVALKEDREDRDILIATIKTLYGLEEHNSGNNTGDIA